MERRQSKPNEVSLVLVDTSVWIALYRGKTRALGQAIGSLADEDRVRICGVVWSEFMGGFRNAERRERLASGFEIYPWLAITDATYRLSAEILAVSSNLGFGDALIAATAVEHGASLMTLGKGFASVQGLGLKVINPV